MAKSQSLVMAGRNCDDSVQILLCCAMTAFVMLPSSVSSLSDWIMFRADSVTLNTPHTTGKSDKIIGTLPRIVGRGEISPIILWCVPSISESHASA